VGDVLVQLDAEAGPGAEGTEIRPLRINGPPGSFTSESKNGTPAGLDVGGKVFGK
jgi:hypothetical protein